MPYAVVLFLDEHSEAQVRAIWHELAERGISRYMQDSGGSPHLTLAVSDSLDVARCEALLKALAGKRSAVPLVLASVGYFPTCHGVAFLGAVVSPALLELHRGIHRRIAPLAGDLWPIYQPECWVPHCTLAIEVPAPALAGIVESCRRTSLPMVGRLERIGVVEFHASEDGGPPDVIPTLCEFHLRAGS